MLALRRCAFALFVDRSNQQWIVLDPEGNLWAVPSFDENPWSQRQPLLPKRGDRARARARALQVHARSADLNKVKHDRRTSPTRRRTNAKNPVEKVGPLPERTPVGNSSRGLQRRRQRLGLFHP